MNTLFDFYKSIKEENTVFLFNRYYELLSEWNEKFNLTAITQKEEVEVKHFADSLAALNYIEGKVLDIGAGAGFPSIPLKIMKPQLNITMADSSNKRVTFLNEVIKKLKLSDITAVHIRAEDIKEKENYDFVVARAVANLSTLAEYMLPFVKIGGSMIAYKSEKVEEEVKEAEKAIDILGGKKPKIIKINLDKDTERSLVIIKKEKKTPTKYPRGQNKPRLSPLK